ncbi:hypothetical protein CHARACLAT_016180, partial [Characodon lateralis]|nr:hypothetical protein [Characodon lateralis]
TVCLILLFSQYLSKVDVPMIAYKDKKWKVFQYPLFKLFSALFGMCGAWLVCFLLTVFDALPSKFNQYGYSARTDINLNAVTNSPWFYMPYPGKNPSSVNGSSVPEAGGELAGGPEAGRDLETVATGGEGEDKEATRDVETVEVGVGGEGEDKEASRDVETLLAGDGSEGEDKEASRDLETLAAGDEGTDGLGVGRAE